MKLIDKIKKNDILVVNTIDLNNIIENEQVEDWLQISDSFGSYINIKLKKNNYCTLIVKGVNKTTNLQIYLSEASLAKENRNIS